MEIRRTTEEDLPRVLELFAGARAFMRQNGNPTQWGDSYPAPDLILEDIRSGGSHVCLDEGRIVGTFYFAPGPDPTYSRIEGGSWLQDSPYSVVHRVVSDGSRKGIASFCLQWCAAQQPHLRIDTHRDNIPMQKTVEKNGFVRCGIIFLANGSERLAYERI